MASTDLNNSSSDASGTNGIPSKNYWMIAVGLLVGAGLAFAYTVRKPEYYSAKGKIILPNSGSKSSLGGISQSLGINLGSDSSSLGMYTAILKSEAELDLISKATGIPKKRLRIAFIVKEDNKANTIEISSIYDDKEKALQIVKTGIGVLNNIKSRINLPLKSDQAAQLANALANRQKQLEEAEKQLEAFLKEAKTTPAGSISVSQPTKEETTPNKTGGSSSTVSGAMGPSMSYKQQLTTLEVEMQRLNETLGAIFAKSVDQKATPPMDLPPMQLWADKLVTAQQKLDEQRAKYKPDSREVKLAEKNYSLLRASMQRDVDKYLKAVESNLAGSTANLSIAKAGVQSQINSIKKYVEAAPRETLQYLRLSRAVATNEGVVNQVRLMYERALLEKSGDPNSWSILDEPAIDEEFDGRKMTRNVGVGAILGLMIGFFAATRRKKA